jgi:hypothetical protein
MGRESCMAGDSLEPFWMSLFRSMREGVAVKKSFKKKRKSGVKREKTLTQQVYS